MATRKIIGDAWVELRGDSKKLRKDINDAVTLDKSTEDALAKNLQDSFDKAFDKLNTDKLMDKLSEVIVKLEIDNDHFRAQVQALNQIINDEVETVKINVEIDDEAFNGVKKRLTEEVEHVEIVPVLNKERAEETEDDLDEVAKGRSAQVSADYNTLAGEYVSARLAWLTRPRNVEIIARISEPHYEEAFLAIAGYRMLDKTREGIWNILKDLDKSIPKIMLMTGAFGYLSSVVLTAANNVFSIAYDVGRISALALPLPGIFAGMAWGAGVTVAAFRDFNEVLPFVSDQLGVIQDKISEAFWAAEAGGDRIESATRYILDMMERELPAVGAALGDYFGALGASIEKIFTADVFARLFSDLNESIEITTEYTDAWVNAMRILGELGSAYLPRLADWAGRIGEQFESWLIAKEDSGQLIDWIEGGIDALHQFWDVLKNTGGVLKDFSQLAHEAGGSTLVTLNEALLTIRETIADPTFRENFIGIFRGARDMMEEVALRSGPAFNSAMDALSKDVIYAFDSLGRGVGEVLEGLFSGLSTEKFSSGFRDFIDGVSKGLDGLSQYLPAIMEGFGALLSIVGELAERFGPLLGRFLEVLAELLIGLEVPLKGLVVLLTDFVAAVLELNPYLLLFGAALVFATGGVSGLVGKLTGLAAGIVGIGTSASVATVALRGLLLASGVGAAIFVLTGIIELFTARNKEAKQATEAFAGGVEAIDGALNDVGVQAFTDQMMDAFGAKRLGELEAYGLGIENLTAGMSGGVESARAYIDALNAQADALDTEIWERGYEMSEEQVNSYQRQINAIREVVPALEDQYAAIEQNAEIANIEREATIASARARGELVDALGRTEDALKKETDARRDSTDSFFEEREAAWALEDAKETLLDAMKNEESTTRDIERAKDRYAQSLQRVIDATFEESGNAADAVKAYQEKYDELMAIEGVTEDYARAVLDIPEEAITQFMIDNGEAEDILADINGAILQWDSETYTAFIDGDIVPAQKAIDLLAEAIRTTNVPLPIGFDEMDIADKVEAVRRLAEANDIEIPATINGDDMTFEEQLIQIMALIAGSEGVIPVTADVNPAINQVSFAVIDAENNQITIPANAELTQAVDGMATFRTEAGEEIEVPVSALPESFTNTVSIEKSAAEEPVSMKINAETDMAQAVFDAFKGQIRGAVATIDINAETDMAQAVFDGLKGQIRGAVATLDINAETDMADAVLAAWKTRANAVQAIRINADPRMADAVFTRLKTTIEKTITKTKIDANDSQAMRVFNRIIRTIALTTATFKIAANAGSAYSTWSRLYSSINGKVMTTYIRTVALNADGNFFPSIKSFAAGGMENHIAQIAQPSSMLRVWAEPETGGEAYIPLALSKRLRSLKILEEVAKIFGYMLVPNLKKFAEGGLLNTVPSISSPTTNPLTNPTMSRTTQTNTATYYITVEINPSDLDGIRSIEQFVQTLRRKTRQGIG